jgi:hypothetical protein
MVVFCGVEASDGTEPMSSCINLVLEGTQSQVIPLISDEDILAP